MKAVARRERATLAEPPETSGRRSSTTIFRSPSPLTTHDVARPFQRRRHLRPLSRPVRLALLVGGWIVTLAGIAGLFLPVLQGVLFLFLGLAMLSVSSRTVHGWLRGLFRRWPRGWRRMEKLRRKLHLRLQGKE